MNQCKKLLIENVCEFTSNTECYNTAKEYWDFQLEVNFWGCPQRIWRDFFASMSEEEVEESWIWVNSPTESQEEYQYLEEELYYNP
jgi:hypothetical protein